jgi:hypothetical protein
VDHRPGAHGAGLKGGIEFAAGEPVVAEGAGSLAHGDNLGMGCGVEVAQDAILPAAD